MLDIKWIRENPEALDAALAKRGAEPQAQSLVALDEKRRSAVQKAQDMLSRRNLASKEIGAAMAQKNGELAEKLKAEVAELKTLLPAIEEEDRQLTAELNDALSRIPNIPFDDVPVGKDEHDNVVTRTVGEKPRWNHTPKEHFEIGEALGYMDFERAAKLSGSRFTVLTGPLARLERALGQFMIDLHTREHGYTEVSSPLMVRAEALFGTGNLPKFEEDLFKTTDDRYLIPTAEVTLTNLVREEILEQEKLPLRFTALTPSFRSEAGSAGRDTRGMLRQHQFWKCELVSITDADSAIAEHERMTACAEEVLKRLGLHFRTMTLCTGDMGFGSRKTYDLEVWLPGQNAFREISSCSVCGDFQARRMNARYRGKDDKTNRFVHTLNGSGTAVGRCLIAVLENYLNEDGSVTIPDVLLPYMGGLTKIERAA
ncbi:seryl-tRNA synthetase [Rhizobium phaseoli]|uniref:Serine--tRNA ligase n=2 Tax=Rhizobium TaxID=379 RepID=SYS_RHIE6|nr:MULTISPECIES: serine--tRNA ligase [Rhizobium]B3PXU3.1 RecName: Full=Serine--tRNA ligase; AltName: Full=Seryl-tRNA synthetase; Short=SerRS; AltName: Full=Seryl-tRNA(Ser/Sec) synthetase [Rhizobium etli CIAT 652]MDH6647904.1 seryl-tRNA synthetase [Rhizobium esperanzae]ACE90879.1 seryl-tRNA synthetase protein [Rhizobium etli CIAT 652]ANL27704.1 seryl-tRNA synthetase [Rhizobium phaseoli]ANL40313.1 seryl-tRNA synthetase [Rhizobium phaseoli]ANL53069.1 seryl-tRNA synthetase [Rhizobium phaseoli]